MLPRPRIRLPLWAALVIPGTAYLVRSVALRAGDFTPQMPDDLIVAGIVLIAVAMVGLARRERD